MTASVPNRHSPKAEVKNSVANMGSFVVDQNFLQNQTIKGMSSQAEDLLTVDSHSFFG